MIDFISSFRSNWIELAMNSILCDDVYEQRFIIYTHVQLTVSVAWIYEFDWVR